MFENMNMGNLGDKMMNKFFRKVDNAVWDMFTGRIGVLTEDGITTIEGEGEDAQVAINMMDQFGMAVPAFAQSTPLADVAIGDLIYLNGRPKGWVTEIVKRTATDDKPESTKFRLMSPSGTSSLWTPPKISMLGFDSGVMVLRSLMNMLPGGKSGLDSMSGMLMPMMMMGGDMDLDSIMPMMLFSQLGASGNGSDANPMAGNNMVQMMMMAQMMGGGNKKKGGRKPNNPFGGGGSYFDD